MTVGTGPYGVALGDVNLDGWTDVVVTNAGTDFLGDSITTLLSLALNPQGHVQFLPQKVTSVGQSPGEVALVDFNNDGRLDCVTPIYFANSVAVLTNTGVSTVFDWKAPVYYRVRDELFFCCFFRLTAQQTGVGPNGVATGRFDGDAFHDVVVCNADAGTVSVFFNQITPQPTVPPPTPVSTSRVSVGGIIAGCIIAGILVAALIVLMFVMWRKKPAPTPTAPPARDVDLESQASPTRAQEPQQGAENHDFN